MTWQVSETNQASLFLDGFLNNSGLRLGLCGLLFLPLLLGGRKPGVAGILPEPGNDWSNANRKTDFFTPAEINRHSSISIGDIGVDAKVLPQNLACEDALQAWTDTEICTGKRDPALCSRRKAFRQCATAKASKKRTQNSWQLQKDTTCFNQYLSL